MKNRGFTLGEIVTTVAIIGVLSAIAVPNFMRIRMDVNMEMVRQALRAAGEKLTEIMGTKKRFPAGDEIGAGAAGEDELSLTATLSALTAKGYSFNYTTDTTGSTATIRSAPLPGSLGTSGDKCFLWNTSDNVIDIPCWSAQGLNLANVGLMPGQFGMSSGDFKAKFNSMGFPMSNLLLTSSVSNQDKAEMIAGSFEIGAYELEWKRTHGTPNGIATPVPGAILAYECIILSQSGYETFRTLIPQVDQILESKGIQMFAGNFNPKNGRLLVGFTVENPILDQADYNDRIDSVSGPRL